MIRYQRWLSDVAIRQIMPGGIWSFLLEDLDLWRAGDPYALNLQLRENNRLGYYHAGQLILAVNLGQANVIDLTANSYYTTGFGDIFGAHSDQKAAQLRARLPAYLGAVTKRIKQEYYKGEGYWESVIATRYAQTPDPLYPFFVVDRQCVLGFEDTPERDLYFEHVRAPYREFLQGKPVHRELDLMLLRPGGRISPGELKNGNSKEIPEAPVQVSIYHGAFGASLTALSPDLRKLIEQKVRLGLMSPQAREYLPPEHTPFSLGDRVIIVSEAPREAAPCWGAQRAMLRRLREAQGDFNLHLLKVGARPLLALSNI